MTDRIDHTAEAREHIDSVHEWQESEDSHGLGDYPCCDEYTEYYIDTLAASAFDVPALLTDVRRLRAMEQRVREYADQCGVTSRRRILAALDGRQ